MSIPYIPSDQILKRLCIDCKHYIPSSHQIHASYGFCRKYPQINPVDGSFTWLTATHSRLNLCHGKWFDDKNSNLGDGTDQYTSFYPHDYY